MKTALKVSTTNPTTGKSVTKTASFVNPNATDAQLNNFAQGAYGGLSANTVDKVLRVDTTDITDTRASFIILNPEVLESLQGEVPADTANPYYIYYTPTNSNVSVTFEGEGLTSGYVSCAHKTVDGNKALKITARQAGHAVFSITITDSSGTYESLHLDFDFTVVSN